MVEDDRPVYVMPRRGFQCPKAERREACKLEAWLYGLRLLRSWASSRLFIYFYLHSGFIFSPAGPCVYSMDDGTVFLLVHVAEIQIRDSDEVQIEGIIYKLKKRFQIVNLGDAKLLLVIQFIRVPGPPR